MVQTKPLVIAGPCVAESQELLQETSKFLADLARKLDFELVFKASFDKANRTSIDSYRGPGWKTAAPWFEQIKSQHACKTLTDVHETAQVKAVAEVIDILQVPAFLCRQTDLVVACVETKRQVNIKKGQFMAPEAMIEIVNKAREVSARDKIPLQVLLTERGASFGYGNLVVDMRSFAMMHAKDVPIIFDITHSTQLPPSGSKTSGGQRQFAPLLARAATATGYLSGFFLEVHPDPNKAKSDKSTQLSFAQAQSLLTQLIPQWRSAKDFSSIDPGFLT